MARLATFLLGTASLVGQALSVQQQTCEGGDDTCTVAAEQAAPLTGYNMIETYVLAQQTREGGDNTGALVAEQAVPVTGHSMIQKQIGAHKKVTLHTEAKKEDRNASNANCTAKPVVEPDPLVLVVNLHAANGSVAAFKDLISEGIGQVRCEPGNVQFDLFDDPTHPNKFVLFEAYKSKAALDAHYAEAPFQAFVQFISMGGIESWSARTLSGSSFADVGGAKQRGKGKKDCTPKSPVDSHPVVLLVDLQILSGRVAEFREVISAGIDEVRCEEGNLQFDLMSDPDDSTKFVLFEVYKDAEALNFHYSQAPFQAFLTFALSGGVVDFQVQHWAAENFAR